MRLSFCELAARLLPSDIDWRRAVERLNRTEPDIVVLNEMPFGPWLPVAARYAETSARETVQLHEDALARFDEIDASLIISSRPVKGSSRLRNEAFALNARAYRPLHQKHFFPSEAGFYEDAWFERPETNFTVHDLGLLKVGVLLCSEVMFNEWARHYGRAGAHLIAVPRASGTTVRTWQAALSMAAVVSGCYVVSSNRVGADGGVDFGGRGFAYAPGGELIAETNADNPVASITIDLGRVASAQEAYPCNVRDLSG